LSRRKGFFREWVKGTYVKKGNQLYEFKLGANHVASEPLDVFDIESSLVEDGHLITGKPTSFVFHTSMGKSFFFMAPSMNDKTKWMQVLQEEKKGQSAPAPVPAPVSVPQPAPAPVHVAPPKSSSSSNMASPAPPYEESKYGQNFHEDVKVEDLETKIPILRFLESFTDPIVVGDISGSIIAFNSAAEKLFGYSKGEVKGSPIAMLMPEPYKSQHDGYLFRHEKFGTEKLIGKTRNLKGERKNGETIDIQISLGKLPVKGYFIATIRQLGVNEEDKKN